MSEGGPPAAISRFLPLLDTLVGAGYGSPALGGPPIPWFGATVFGRAAPTWSGSMSPARRASSASCVA